MNDWRTDPFPTKATHSDWLSWLAAMLPKLTSEQSVTIMLVWLAMLEIDQNFPAPEASIEENCFWMAWDAGKLHLDLEIGKDGKFDWFFRNRETSDYAGNDNDSDEPNLDALTDDFLQLARDLWTERARILAGEQP